jgi:large subunit ribosomal protein L17
MRHGKKNNHLGRTTSHRKAMLANMASSLIKHKRIITTVAKAKTLRIYIEPLITKSKDATTHNYRTVFAYLKDKEAVTELFTVVSGKVANRPGGYTRILKTGNRAGDNADMAMIELVDFNEFFDGFAKDKKKATTRRSRRSGSTATTTDAPATKTAAPKAAVVEEIQDAVVVEEVVDAVAPIVEAKEETPAAETTTEDSPTEETSSDETSTEETK